MLLQRLIATRAQPVVLLIRIMLAIVFIPEGIQKFLYADALGAGRFARIGIPAPEVMGPFVGVVEIVCGILILVGLATRLATLPLLIDMFVAILSTKVPILIGQGFWGFQLPKLDRYGIWSMLHEARTDFSMWLGLTFLLVVGAGRLSVDAWLFKSAPDTESATSRTAQ